MSSPYSVAIAIVVGVWLAAAILVRRLKKVERLDIPPEEMKRLEHLVPPAAPPRQAPGWILYLTSAVVAASLALVSADLRGLVCIAWVGVPPAALLVWFVVLRMQHPELGEQRRLFDLVNEGDAVQALRDARQAIDTRGPSADRWSMLGLILAKLERWAEARDAFGEAARLAPDELIHRGNLALALWKSGATGEALSLMPSVIEKHPLEPSYRAHHCRMLADAGRFDEARAELHLLEEIFRAAQLKSDSMCEAVQSELDECRRAVGAT